MAIVDITQKIDRLIKEGKLAEVIDLISSTLESGNFSPVERIELYYKAGTSYIQLRDFNSALREFLVVEKEAQLLHHDEWLSKAEHSIANMHYMLTNYSKALEYYEKSLELKKRHGMDIEGQLKVLNNIAAVHKTSGDYNRALDYYLHALRLVTKHEDKISQMALGTLLNNIGVIYQEKGDPEKALEYYSKSNAVQTDQRLKGTVVFNIGNVYLELGDLTSAAEYYNDSKEIWEKTGEEGNLAYSYMHTSQLQMFAGNYEEANKGLEKALKLALNHGALDIVPGIMVEQAKMAMLKGEHEKAEELFSLAEERQIDSESTEHMLQLYCQRSLLYLDWYDSPEKAITYIDEAEKIARKHDSKKDIIHVELFWSIYHLRKKNFDQAQELLDRILATDKSTITFETRINASLRRAELYLERYSCNETNEELIKLALNDLNDAQREIISLSLIPLKIEFGMLESMFLELQFDFDNARKKLEEIRELVDRKLKTHSERINERIELLDLHQKIHPLYEQADTISSSVKGNFDVKEKLSKDIRDYIKEISAHVVSYPGK
ncbi:MAG: tetratricopeptide repeat protein [Candidatus Hodarchaeales archaeon]